MKHKMLGLIANCAVLVFSLYVLWGVIYPNYAPHNNIVSFIIVMGSATMLIGSGISINKILKVDK